MGGLGGLVVGGGGGVVVDGLMCGDGVPRAGEVQSWVGMMTLPMELMGSTAHG